MNIQDYNASELGLFYGIISCKCGDRWMIDFLMDDMLITINHHSGKGHKLKYSILTKDGKVVKMKNKKVYKMKLRIGKYWIGFNRGSFYFRCGFKWRNFLGHPPLFAFYKKPGPSLYLGFFFAGSRGSWKENRRDRSPSLSEIISMAGGK